MSLELSSKSSSKSLSSNLSSNSSALSLTEPSLLSVSVSISEETYTNPLCHISSNSCPRDSNSDFKLSFFLCIAKSFARNSSF